MIIVALRLDGKVPFQNDLLIEFIRCFNAQIGRFAKIFTCIRDIWKWIMDLQSNYSGSDCPRCWSFISFYYFLEILITGFSQYPPFEVLLNGYDKIIFMKKVILWGLFWFIDSLFLLNHPSAVSSDDFVIVLTASESNPVCMKS